MITGKTREDLLIAGINEIDKYGVSNFSVRRVAAACGVSCATPYKHFKDKNDFIFSMIRYINVKWYAIQKDILLRYPGDTRKRIVEIGISYINFLLDNPTFRTIIMQSHNELNSEQMYELSNLSQCSSELIETYCNSVNMSADARKRKTFIVRSIIYGASLMIDNGQLERTPEVFDMIRSTIEREFDII